MATIEIMDLEKNVKSEKTIDDAIFGLETRGDILHTVVVAQLASRRKGTSSTKTRSEVAGGGRKPWRQKGTGRARAGTLSSPIFRSGGIVFGPKPRDYNIKVNKKVRKSALKNALSLKFREGNLIILDALDIDAPKTKEFLKLMGSLDILEALFVDVEPALNIILGARNLKGCKVMSEKALNVYDILRFEHLVMTLKALEQIEERLA